MKLNIMLAAGLAVLWAGAADAKTYVMTASADFSGPFADVMPNNVAGLKAIVKYWNETKGAELGVDVDLKVYDMRYDGAVVAKTWPAALASDSPIMHLGFGSPDLVTLMGRLPNDKVPMLLGTALVGLVWKPEGWHFSIRPTYSHEFAGLFSELQTRKGDTLRIAAISTQNQAGFVDQVNGVEQLAKQYPDRFEVTGVHWADASPVSLSAQVRSALSENPDLLLVGGTTAQVIAASKALKEQGADLPIVTSTHNGLDEVAKAVPLSDLTGSYAAFAFAAPDKADLPIRAVFEKYKTDGDWTLITGQAAAQAILALRVLEKSIADVGADNVTGQSMYDALLGHTYTEEELLGALPTLDYDATAPFPVGEIKSTAQVVRDGAIVGMSDDWFAVPTLEKW